MRKAFVFNQAWNGRSAGEIERIIPDGQTPPSIFLTSNGLCDIVDVPDGDDENHLQTTFNEQWDKDFLKRVQITLTQADDHQYDVTLGGVTVSHTSGTGETSAQIVAALVAKLSDIVNGLGNFSFTDNADGTYDIEGTSLGDDYSESYDANQSSALVQAHHESTQVDPADQSWTYSSWYTISEDTAAKTAADKTNQITGIYGVMNADVLAQMASVFGTTNPDSASAYERTWNLMVATPSDWSSAGLTARFAVGGLAIGDALDTDQKVTDYATAKVAEVKAYGIWRMQRIETFRTDKAAIEAS